MNFVNRTDELAALEKWWARPGPSMGILYGRRRVGKTALINQFAKDKRSIIHLGIGVPLAEELATFTEALPGTIDLRGMTPQTWDQAINVVAEAAKDEPYLLVLDEFPELLGSDPHLEGRLRAVWEKVIRSGSNLKLLLSGSAVRTMWSIGEERAPLYGRFDLRLLVHPFRPHEAAMMLRHLKPVDRAVVWGICGGTPLYLSWWDQDADVTHNIRELFCLTEARLRQDAELVLATDGVAGGLAKQVLSAIALGKNRHSEIVDAVPSDRQVATMLDNLEKLRLVDRVVPVVDDQRAKHGRTTYRIADNMLAFWLSVVERHKAEIERGHGLNAARAIAKRVDNHMGPRYEEALREFLWSRLTAGDFGDEALKVGPFWTRGGAQVEIDAVVLNDEGVAIAVGECKWQHTVNGAELRTKLLKAARALPNAHVDLEVIVCARDEVTDAGGIRPVTASDIFV